MVDFASKWSIRLDALKGESLEEWLFQCLKPSAIESERNDLIVLILFLLFYMVWHSQNHVVFEGPVILSKIVHMLEAKLEECVYVMKQDFTTSPAVSL